MACLFVLIYFFIWCRSAWWSHVPSSLKLKIFPMKKEKNYHHFFDRSYWKAYNDRPKQIIGFLPPFIAFMAYSSTKHVIERDTHCSNSNQTILKTSPASCNTGAGPLVQWLTVPYFPNIVRIFLENNTMS